MDRNDVIRPAIDVFLASLSARRAWIEMLFYCFFALCNVSLSARRAWIEILNAATLRPWTCVALRKESVDRNKESGQRKHLQSVVALRKESVDRNTAVFLFAGGVVGSLSARRAWIEISGLLLLV